MQGLRYADVRDFLEVLGERQTAKSLVRGSGLQVVYYDLLPGRCYRCYSSRGQKGEFLVKW